MPTKPKQVPRGIRNNNPLNIRIGNTWLGERQCPTDSEFEEFVSMQYGLRAAFVILRRYIRHYQRNTIEKIISTWAPSSENQTENYIQQVCKMTGIDRYRLIDYSDKYTMCVLVAAMAKMECGVDIDKEAIRKGYDIA